MLGDFNNAEFIELVQDLMQDAPLATILHYEGPEVYNSATLKNERPVPTRTPARIGFIGSKVTQAAFDRQVEDESFSENKVAFLDYRGDLNTLDKIEVPNMGTYTVTGISSINPLGVVIYQKVKISK